MGDNYLGGITSPKSNFFFGGTQIAGFNTNTSLPLSPDNNSLKAKFLNDLNAANLEEVQSRLKGEKDQLLQRREVIRQKLTQKQEIVKQIDYEIKGVMLKVMDLS